VFSSTEVALSRRDRSWSDSSSRAPLSEAVWESQRIQIGYDRGDKTVDRVLEPLGLVLKAGVWYLIARADGQPRTYRVSRVIRVTSLDERFERPADFDLAAFWTDSSSAYERDTPRIEVVLRLAPERLPRLRDVIGDRPYETLERLAGADPDGWLHVRVKLDWPNEVVSQILAVGPDCELVEPAALRERVAAQARRVASHYDQLPGVSVDGRPVARDRSPDREPTGTAAEAAPVVGR
jgi:predicted DNA-binding transcriptional regulator YafY